MSLGTFFQDYGAPPENCTRLQSWLLALNDQLTEANPIRCGSSAAAPSNSELTALWSPCDPPTGALALWYDTAAGELLYYVTLDGGTNWLEVVL